ncbi:HlyD family efflux transporter periplasmic adaptor subunit [Phyllobacterium sp. 0TCS1.6C]|uniref:HlyD family secretion protein n=1 Tax=unclassified Phyllobacterium TaxID=2638441 RepID=UPI0022655437|nr:MULTISPECIES: HlyD family efflux transporter periplasmic adaptor subunit [unclassified Phyllobacterium]MCX8278686.1 HlyD family efflux transporter periplasmic adaptor subunit [Phyllobacterium sp. 0TCS1.6C]MCX8293484.1 HlyD family efflux transporter periplasmic adaptor subunit [Phyllobacterium sp. 0TCS1.6A]
MKYIRKRLRIDNLDRQQRKGSGRLSRSIYLLILGVLVLSLANYLVGGMFILSADGIVLAERYIVSAGYPATVDRVLVSEGDSVPEGTPLLELTSFDMVKEIAELSVRTSELAVRAGELQGKLAMNEALLPLAERSARESNDAILRLDRVSTRGLVLANRRDEALTANYRAAERYAQLQAESQVTAKELLVVETSQQIASDAVRKMKAIYGDGRIVAAVTGVVGSKIPVPGQVVRLGDEMLQINGGKAYLFAYLPDEYLFPLTKGTRIEVHGGSDRSTGTVERVLPIADALPAEFQNLLRPRDRSRLIRIALPEDHPFAVTQKVVIRGCVFGWCWVR